MKSKRVYTAQQRRDLVTAVERSGQSMQSQIARLGIDRKTAYRWIERYRQYGLEGLLTRSSRPHQQAGQLPPHVVERLMQMRRRHPTWGPKKLSTLLFKGVRKKHRYSVRTMGRWLRRHGLSHKMRHRALPGPKMLIQGLTTPSKPHDVWTIDFKGWTRTSDGKRWDPLTIRDLYSRMILLVQLLPNQSEEGVRPVMQRLFGKHGLPRIIRVDNGSPFGGRGPMGLTVLSLWWRRLGIQVEFTRRASPQDNGAHEQFHRVYKAEVFNRKASHGPALQSRSNHWIHHYNHQRPHESLSQIPPARFYRKNPRSYRPLSPFSYPQDWKIVRVTSKGYIRWKGRIRLISQITGGLRIGLKLHSKGYSQVYVDSILIGTLYPLDKAGMRPAKLVRKPNAM